MTNSPNDPEVRSPSRSRRFWGRVALGTGVVVLVGGVIAVRQILIFIYEDLAPLVERDLSQTLNRPVALGPVEGVSLNRLSFGASSVPATETDQDQVSLDAVEVRFNLLELLLTRTLRLNLTLINPNLFIDQDEDGTWIKTRIETKESEGPITTELDVVRIQNATLVLAPAPQLTTAAGEPPGFEDPAKRPQVIFQQLNGDAVFRDENTHIAFDIAGISTTEGTFRLRGDARTETQAVNLVVQGQNLLASDISSLLPLPLSLQAGRLAANLEVRFRQNEPLAFNGTARFRNVTATIANVPNRFTQANGRLRFQEQLITLENVRGRYGQIPARASGTIHTEDGYNLAAQVRSLDVNTLVQTFDLPSPVALSGRLNADLRLTGALNEPVIAGTAANASPLRVDRVNFGIVRTRFSLIPSTLSFTQLEAIPAVGGRITGDGRVVFGAPGTTEPGRLAFALRARDVPGDAIARPYGFTTPNLTLGRIAADVLVGGAVNNFQTVVRFQAPNATYPGQGNLIIAGNTFRLENVALQVAGGTVTARATAAQGRWQALVNAAQVRLNQFSPELRGLFSGDVRLSGSLNAFSPSAVRAQGQVRFSEGIALLERLLTATIQWTGERLLVQQATAQDFNANGFLLVQLEGAGAPAITGLNLNVNLQNYDVAALPIPTPAQVQLRGQTNFSGQVTGTPAAPAVVGQVRLNNLMVNDLTFEPVLRGTFRYAGGQGLALNVSGAQDQIVAQLDGRNRPVSFLVRQGEFVAEGRGEGDRLLATVENAPLEILNLSPGAALGLGEISGRLSGSFDINLANLNNPTVVGTVAIARPALGYIRGDRLIGQFRYADGTVVLDSAELNRADSRYLIVGTLTPAPVPQFQGQITIDQGSIQDVLTAFQWFELDDFARGITPPIYASATAVNPIPIQTFGTSLINQLRRYSEIVALLEQQQEQRDNASPLPDLAELQGAFSGVINVASTPQEGLTADFNVRGQNWRWDEYGINQVVAEGNFANGVLTLLPFRLQGLTYARRPNLPGEEEAFLAFSGQIGGPQQSGQLRLQNIDVEVLRDFFALPVDLDGNLNATATLSGSQQNPQVVGELNLVGGSLNNTTVQEAGAIFGFNNARLNFSGRVVVDEPQPLSISGSVPALLPFLDQTLNPGDEISLDVDVQDEGLALLNLLTRRQLLWEGGDGDVQLRVRGTLAQPLVTGTATFANAQFAAQALPESLTDVAGTIQFNSDRIRVETLQGRFSDGQVLAQGVLPIFNPFRAPDDTQSPTTDTPLTVFLSDLALNLKGLYNGGVNGQVVVTGTALAPRLGGEIVLSNGRVLLPEGTQPTTAPATDSPDGITTPPQFNNLRLTLGNNLLITRDPILNFVAAGDLLLNGTLDSLRPNGTINLRSGQVNLFTTQFTLARGYDSRAIFTPERGLDPFIDVRLNTSVIEVTRAPALFQNATPYAPSEVADTSIGDFGAFQTVRVQASVAGPASELFENLELTSSPRRSENEIVALLGGSFINTLGQGDGTLAIANLAGSALLTRVQNVIGNALGLSEFRLFPTTIADEDERTSSFGLAAELGVDITSNLSVSAIRILTDEVPTQFNLRYRLSDEFLLRGSTNLSGDNRAVLEFETRF